MPDNLHMQLVFPVRCLSFSSLHHLDHRRVTIYRLAPSPSGLFAPVFLMHWYSVRVDQLCRNLQCCYHLGAAYINRSFVVNKHCCLRMCMRVQVTWCLFEATRTDASIRHYKVAGNQLYAWSTIAPLGPTTCTILAQHYLSILASIELDALSRMIWAIDCPSTFCKCIE